MFNLEFVGCQAVVANPPGTQPVSFGERRMPYILTLLNTKP